MAATVSAPVSLRAFDVTQQYGKQALRHSKRIFFSDWKESSQRFHAQAPMGTPQAPSPNPPSMVT